MRMNCLKDICPESGKSVDMRRCCGEHSWSRACKYYGGKPWSEFRYATCDHPHAQANNLGPREHYAMELRAVTGTLPQ